MGRRDDFFRSTLLICGPFGPHIGQIAKASIQETLEFTEDDFPPLGEITVGILEWHAWIRGSNATPEWVKHARENVAARKKAAEDQVEVHLTADAAGNHRWWMLAEGMGEVGAIPKSCELLVSGRNIGYVRAPRADAKRFIEWARTVPGWYDQPVFKVLDKDNKPVEFPDE